MKVYNFIPEEGVLREKINHEKCGAKSFEIAAHINTLKEYPASGFNSTHVGRDLVEGKDFELTPLRLDLDKEKNKHNTLVAVPIQVEVEKGEQSTQGESAPAGETDFQIAWKLSQTSDKPFFINDLRSLIIRYNAEQISMSKFLEELNIAAYKWAKEAATPSNSAPVSEVGEQDLLIEVQQKKLMQLQEDYNILEYKYSSMIMERFAAASNQSDAVKYAEKVAYETSKKNADLIIEIERLKSAASNGWVSVKERLPEVMPSATYSEEVLVFVKEIYGKEYLTLSELWKDGFWTNQLPVTHWMPLPSPPNTI